jgi:hypothetical protein
MCIGSPRARVRSASGWAQVWSDVAHNFRGDWQILWKEMTAGFVIAGFVAVLPGSVFEAALLTDAPLGGIPETRPSIESITDRGISLNYTAVLNILFTLVGAALVYLTIWRGAKDPVCRMRVDRFATPHTFRLRRPDLLLLQQRLQGGVRDEVGALREARARHARRTTTRPPAGAHLIHRSDVLEKLRPKRSRNC